MDTINGPIAGQQLPGEVVTPDWPQSNAAHAEETRRAEPIAYAVGTNPTTGEVIRIPLYREESLARCGSGVLGRVSGFVSGIARATYNECVWTVHNCVAHPVMQVCWLLSLGGLVKPIDRFGKWFHDVTVGTVRS